MIAGLLLAGLLSVSIIPSANYSGSTTIVEFDGMNFVATPTDSPQPGGFNPARFDSATAGALRVLFDSATAHGLPQLPLINLANRGNAMRASGSKILSMVRGHYAAMLEARTVLGDNSSESELDSGADALQRGVDVKALAAIRTTRPVSGSAVSALVVITDLVNRGIPTGKARDAITALARASKSDDGINGLQMLVARNAERGPGMAQDAMDRYLRINAPGGSKNAPPKTAPRPPSTIDQP